MNPWLDGLLVFFENIRIVLVILLVILWGFLLTRGLLKRFLGDSITEADLLSLSSAGWVVPVLFLSLLTFGVSIIFNAVMGGIFAGAVILISFISLREKIDWPYFLLFSIILFASIILPLAFIKNLSLPLYFDSVEHYRLIDVIIRSYQLGTPIESSGSFYHLGFHFVSAGIAYFSHTNIARFMLVFGQVVLAILPTSLFFVVRRETGSIPAAFLSSLLVGFGFHMPGHLMNWGKYPALLSLVCILFVFGLAYMIYRPAQFGKRKVLFVLLGFSILASALIHTRTLILYGLMFIAALMTLMWSRLSKTYKLIGWGLLLTFFIALIYSTQITPPLDLLFAGYLKDDSWMLILILVLAVFSAVYYTESTFFLLLWFALCGLCLFIPITLPTYGVQTLLDRPFVQMFSCIPLSILGGLGLSGLMKTTIRLLPDLKLVQHFVTLFIFGFVLLNAALHYKFYPSDCCNFVSRDDLAAFAWMDNNIPSDAKILAASTGLYVTSYESSQTPTGVDAGIWIPPLLSRPIVFAGRDIRFDSDEVHTDLCEQEVDYIYADGTSQSFDFQQLDGLPEWYLQMFALPSARVYKIAACG